MTQPTNDPTNQRVPRPLSVTILVVVVLIFTSLNALRWITAYEYRAFFEDSSLELPIPYIVVSGVFWTIIGIPLAVGLFFGKKWSFNFVRFYLILYGIYYWIDRLFVAEPQAIASRWQFALTVSVAILIFSFWILSTQKVKIFLKQSSSIRTKNQTE